MMRTKPERGEMRDVERLRAHYLVERGLADRLREAPREKRSQLYGVVYDELFQSVPDHPQITRKTDEAALRGKIDPQLRMLRPFLKPETTFLEVGAGDCRLSVEIAQIVRRVYAVDVSAEIARVENAPASFQLIVSDGCNIPVPAGSVDVVYSNQLMEHLHPEDALDQLRAIHTALAPGGIYLCVTPNRLSGPHDISKYFDDVATGFHLKEYTAGELSDIFRRAGFSQVRALHGAAGRFLQGSAQPVILLERVLARTPVRFRRALPMQNVLRGLLGIQLIGVK